MTVTKIKKNKTQKSASQKKLENYKNCLEATHK